MVSVRLGGFQNMEMSTTFQVREVKRQILDITYKIEDISQQNLLTFRREFELVSSQLFLHDPKNILQKGYAIVRQDGEIVERKANLKKGRVSVEFQDGNVEVPPNLAVRTLDRGTGK
jgi:exodeoxyribonuclease VII large subunit